VCGNLGWSGADIRLTSFESSRRAEHGLVSDDAVTILSKETTVLIRYFLTKLVVGP
jgi:hypothetical protein